MINLIFSLLLLLSFQSAFAANQFASCYLQDQRESANSQSPMQQLQGRNVDVRYPIASVSKVMTSYFAIKKLGPKARYQTPIYIKKIDSKFYDIHLQGSRDPFAGRSMLQFLVSELNSKGIKNIRKLTFDENFKYFDDVTGHSAAIGHFGLNSPSADEVTKQLRYSLANLKSGYSQLIGLAKTELKFNLSNSISLSVGEVRLLSKQNFEAKEFDQMFLYKSAPMTTLLKEMNRSSNNHAANQIFESLGGEKVFANFIQNDLGLTNKEIRFVNGSGDRLDYQDGSFQYNEATCRAVVKVVMALRNELKANESSLQEVMAVAGQDAIGERSTVTALYDNEVTHGAMIAKTGTVNPAITLAGLLQTEEGRIYFGYIYKTNGSVADWREARYKIRQEVTELMQEHQGGVLVDYQARKFLPFDADSKLQIVLKANLS